MKRAFCFGFCLAFVLTAALGFGRAGREDEEVPPRVAESVGTVVVDDCDVTGFLVGGATGIHARVTFTNATESARAISLHYAVSCTPGASPFSRMMVLPRTVKSGTLTVTVPAGGGLIREFPVTAPATETVGGPAGAGNAAVPAPANAFPDVWTLAIARGELTGSLGVAGALPLAVSPGRVTLEQGQAVLARTVVAPNEGA